MSRHRKKSLDKKKKLEENKYIEQLKKSKQRFKTFYEQIPHVGEQEYSKKELVWLEDQFQYFICGSDQIWSPKFLDDAYYLNFVKHAKRIAYAPSMGTTELTNQEKQYIIPWIEKFDAVSVRERQTAEILHKNGIENVTVAADPTLLLDRSVWDQRIPVKKLINTDQKIIFTYFLGDNKWYGSVIYELKKKYPNALWVSIPRTYYAYVDQNCSIKLPEAGPEEFVNLIRQSDLVLTDSYHGVCMAVKFQKEFLALKRFSDVERGSENARIESLLEILELQDHFVGENERTDLPAGVDWKKTDHHLEDFVKTSENYLVNSLR